jgi:hypothetical protein
VARVFDTVYPLFVLRVFYVVQALILVVVLAIGPYALVRGIHHAPLAWFLQVTGRANQPIGSQDNGRHGRPLVVLSGWTA